MNAIAQSGLTTEGRDALLRRLYDEQDLAVDVMGGTRQLRELTAAYVAATGIPVDETLMLKRLTAMRKAGELPRKTERGRAERVEAWPDNFDGKAYTVGVAVPVTLDVIVRAIAWVMNRGGTLPVSRAETLPMVRSYFAGAGYGTVGYMKESWERAEFLFPELTTNTTAPDGRIEARDGDGDPLTQRHDFKRAP